MIIVRDCAIFIQLLKFKALSCMDLNGKESTISLSQAMNATFL